jgi:hypothetical protein
MGCGNTATKNEKVLPKDPHDHHQGHHHHEAPNGGVLIELGEEFAHLEFVSDTANNKITCYVFNGSLDSGLKAQQNSIIAEIKGKDESHNVIFTPTISELANNTAESSSQFEADYKFEKGVLVKLNIKKIILKNKIFENIEVPLKGLK